VTLGGTGFHRSSQPDDSLADASSSSSPDILSSRGDDAALAPQ